MIDYFAVFGIERRPAIDDDYLKKTYFRKSQELHPDRADESDFSRINAAFQILLNPATRLQHLLKLEFADAAQVRIGAEFGVLFGRIANLLRQADKETRAVAAQDSPLLRAMAFERLGPLRDNLASVERELSGVREKLLKEVDALDQEWILYRNQCRDRLAQAALNLAFAQKWSTEVRERMLKLEEIVG
jgi:curved DNA-binding protein CbpA